MNISELGHKSIAHTLHPFTNLAQHAQTGPLIFSRAEGIYLYDEQGRRYLEAMAGLWCASLGYSEQRLIDAAQAQFSRLPFSHMFTGRATEPAILLCETLANMAPVPNMRAFLVNSGSEAIDAAIKMVWYYHNAHGRTNKKILLARQHAYHGVTVAGGSLTGLPYVQDGFDLPAINVTHLSAPHYYRYGRKEETPAQFTDRLTAELEAQIAAIGAENIGAFFAEPVMGAGGVLIPPEDYFAKIQPILRQHNILLVADEVICGFARTGNMWGCQTYAIAPDLITCAKQLSAAYQPIGAVLVSDELQRTFTQQSSRFGVFGTGNTYGGHPVAAAVALETLRIYEQRNIVQMVNQVAPQFARRLHALAAHPLVGDARCVGLIGAIEIVQDKSSKTPYPSGDKMAAKLVDHALQHGVIVRALPGDCVGFCPPLIITDEQINQLFDAIEAALDDLANACS